MSALDKGPGVLEFNLQTTRMAFIIFTYYSGLGMHGSTDDEPPDPQQLRLDRMLESEVRCL